MDRLIRSLCFLFLMMLPMAAFADPENAVDSSEEAIVSNFNWEPVINAVVQVESGGNEKARSGLSCGALQITPILVKECNNILKRRKSKKRFTLSDRFSLAKSKEMFILIQSFHNPLNDIEKAIRSWNGGMNYSIKRTQKYFEKVMSYLHK